MTPPLIFLTQTKLIMRVILALCTAAVADQVNPISKVLQMITELQHKVVAEGSAQQKEFDEYSTFCTDQANHLHRNIASAEAEQQDLEAVVDKANSDITKQSTKIEEAAAEQSEAEADLKKATHEREKEFAVFSGEEKTTMETVDAFERAIKLLHKHMGMALVQTDAEEAVDVLSTLVQSESLASADKNQLIALMQSGTEDTEGQAPEAAAYENHDGTQVLIDTLQDLLDKTQATLMKLRNEETKSRGDYQMVKQSLEQEVAENKKIVDQAKQTKAAAEETKAKAEAEIEHVVKDIAADKDVLKELQHDCMEKAHEYEVEMQEQNEELKALAKAKEIIQEATEEATDKQYDLVQTDDESFVQVKMHMRSGAEEATLKAIQFFRSRARATGSRRLALLASKASNKMLMGGDIFKGIRKMVVDMVEKLEKEAEEEAGQKEFCDKEMGEAEEKKGDHEEELEKLTTRLDKAKSDIAKNKEQLSDLQQQLIQIGETQQALSKMRQEQHEAFVEVESDFEKGVKGVQLALKVLREFYSQAEESLVQVAQQTAKSSGAGEGIISMLEIVESDFSKSLAEARQAEQEQVDEYEAEYNDNKVRQAALEADMKGKESLERTLQHHVSEVSDDKAGVQDELDAVLEYLKNLEPKCVSKPEPYEERKKRREEELAGLKEGLQVLEGNAIGFLSVRK